MTHFRNFFKCVETTVLMLLLILAPVSETRARDGAADLKRAAMVTGTAWRGGELKGVRGSPSIGPVASLDGRRIGETGEGRRYSGANFPGGSGDGPGGAKPLGLQSSRLDDSRASEAGSTAPPGASSSRPAWWVYALLALLGGGLTLTVVIYSVKLKFQIRERERAEEELNRKKAYIEALHETTLGLLRRRELNELLQTIVERASALTGLPDGFLYLYDKEEEMLKLEAACGEFQSHVGFQIKPGEGVGGVVWQKGRPVVLDDYQKWPERAAGSRFDMVRAVVGIPLKSGPTIDGVIGLAHHENETKIDPDVVSILEEFSELATIALNNARLYSKMRDELEKRKELEAARDRIAAQLDQAQKMESIGTLAGGIAHDFNNILFPIIGYAEMMVQDVRENSIARNSAIEILKASNRAKELVQQILVFSRQRDHEKEPLWLQPILKEALKLLRATLPATIAIRTEIDDNCGSVLADPTQIHQIIMNLCTNAYHAMRETGGELVVKLNTIDIASGYLSSSQSGVDTGTNLELVISDTGSGMDKEVLERMFEPYYTTKKIGEGTGMGLSMVHGIVQAHNGHIVVDSELGKGTTFRIYLPRIVEDAVQQPVISNLKLPGGDESLLIVDDEAPIIRMEQEMLERLGYTVEGLTSSVEALSLFRESPDKYKLVITDQTMPELTGAELAAELLALRPALPIILCTGFSESITEKNALEIGIKKFIMKPIVINDLAKTVRDALDGKL